MGGYAHSLGLIYANGIVRAWGYNNYGQSTVPMEICAIVFL
ncbi:MAG: hypothetical protein FJ121_09935 [Deltaproteobacteria bacterium]|nr:hypothetical protein [Deltaproteobacteria bacterium]